MSSDRYYHHKGLAEGSGQKTHFTKMLDTGNSEEMDYPINSYCGRSLFQPERLCFLPAGSADECQACFKAISADFQAEAAAEVRGRQSQ